MMRVLVACERFGRVRRALRDIGVDAWCCDTEPCEPDEDDPYGIDYSFQCDVREVLYRGWDGMIGFPTCTYLCSSGLHWNQNDPARAAKTEEAVEFFRLLHDAPIPVIALENPIGCISTRIRKPNQIIQPWQFGADASKATCLWLKNLPLLRPTKLIPPRIVQDGPYKGRKRWANQTDSGQNRLGPSADRAALRGKTYPGIADAMALQWFAPLACRFL